MLDEIHLISQFETVGFKLIKRTKKVLEFGHLAQDVTVYFKRRISKEPFVIHPENIGRMHQIAEIPGVSFSNPFRFNHLSNYRRFPQRIHTGKAPTRYGIALDIDNDSALQVLLRALVNRRAGLLEDLESLTSAGHSETERQTLSTARLGQGQFRDQLIDEFKGRCPVTSVGKLGLLCASHIKPWARCVSNFERLDPNNGLLLAANIDALFDKGYITFDADGMMKDARCVSEKELRAFGVSEQIQVDLRTEARKLYMDFHSAQIFLDRTPY